MILTPKTNTIKILIARETVMIIISIY